MRGILAVGSTCDRRATALRTWALLACATLCALFLFAVSAGPAAAGAPASEPLITAAQAITGTATSETGVLVTQRPLPSPQQTLWYAIVALTFALLSLLVVLGYTYLIQNRYYLVSQTLGKAGKNVKAVPMQPFHRPGGVPEIARDSATPPPPQVAIDGPGVLTVGVASTEFKASLNGVAADQAKWTVEPANVAIVIPAEGATVKVIPAVAGALTVTAAVDGATSGRVQAVAIVPETAGVELPFVGTGYGSIVIAIVLVAGVIVLGLAGVLTGEGVATLLGGLLGYIFGVGVAGGGAGAAGKPQGQGG